MTYHKEKKLFQHAFEFARHRYLSFIHRCKAEDGYFRLTLNSETTPFAFCFAIFGLHLSKLAEDHGREPVGECQS